MLSSDFDSSYLDLNSFSNQDVIHLCSLEFMKQYRIAPLKKQDGSLLVGMIDPKDQTAIEAIAFHTGMRITPVLLQEIQFNSFIETHFTTEITKPVVQEAAVNYDEPLINLTNNILQQAIKKSASDIHIEPYEKSCRIRFRQHGILQEVTELTSSLATRLITRLKVISKLDIAERRLPQDGHFQFNRIDVRINTCPTLFGEKLVLRLLNPNNLILEIDKLGFDATQKNLFLEKISQPQGLILVAGPTGSGKTTTLYSALHYLNNATKNISTAEDPIEIQLAGINQVNINPKIGLHFSTLLRTFLRQDPDVIMIGEIRDAETAAVAIQAAQTGHLVLSTIHATNTTEALSRLKSLGVTEENLPTLSLIISQRLLRILCACCKAPDLVDIKVRTQFNIPTSATLYRPQKCARCQQGYQERLAIFEFLPMSLYHQKPLLTLQDEAIKKAIKGLTSLSEIKRAL